MLPAYRNGVFAPQTNRIASMLDRFMESALTSGESAVQTALPLCLWQDDDHLYLEVDLPGVREGDLDVTIFDGVLHLRGERTCERQEGVFDTRAYGRFEQRLRLPSPVDAEKITAKLASGVLRLTLPKTPEAKPRKIAITG